MHSYFQLYFQYTVEMHVFVKFIDDIYFWQIKCIESILETEEMMR